MASIDNSAAVFGEERHERYRTAFRRGKVARMKLFRTGATVGSGHEAQYRTGRHAAAALREMADEIEDAIEAGEQPVTYTIDARRTERTS